MRYALLREVLATKSTSVYYRGVCHGQVLADEGFRQGSPEASFFFALIMAHLLATLDARRKLKGWGVRLGPWGGGDFSFQAWWQNHCFLYCGLDAGVQDVYLTSLAFLDDVYFVASLYLQL